MESSNSSFIEQETTQQIIDCHGDDNQSSFPIYSTDVLIKPSEISENNTASNKIKVSQISKFEWEEKYYLGNLVTCNSLYIAYVLRAKSSLDDSVRVINHQTSERVLLRGFKKNVIDVCFESFKSSKLACVDSEGTLHVYDISEANDKLIANILLQVHDSGDQESNYRVIWAPHLLLPVVDSEPMVALSIGNKAEVYNLLSIKKNYPDKYEFEGGKLKHGMIRVNDCHTKDITNLALSPDSQVLATCSFDGEVKFWSINFDDPDATPSCLHEWEPHDGEPVTCLFFCDNLLLGDDSSPFWRYLITGTQHNSILKIWCAVKWECVQTIRFNEYIGDSEQPLPCMKVALDISSKYLVLSDIYRPVLYVCNLFQDLKKEKSSLIAVTEFMIRDPLLSFCIYVAKERKRRSSVEENGVEDLVNGFERDTEENGEEVEDRDSVRNVSVISLFGIHKRALSKYMIKYKANASIQVVAPSLSTASQDDLSIKDALSDVEPVENVCEKQVSSQSKISFEINVDSSTNNSLDSSLTGITPIPYSVTPQSGPQEHTNQVVKSSSDEQEEDDNTLIDLTESSIGQSLSTGADSSISQSLISGMEKLSFEISSPAASKLEENLTNGDLHQLDDLKLDRRREMPPLEEKPVSVSVSDERPLCKEIMENPRDSSSQMDLILSLLNKQQSVIDSQKEELKEMKDMMRQLLNKQHTTITSSSSDQMTGDRFESDKEDLQVYMQLLQKSANSHFNKASKEFTKQCTQRLEQLTKDLHTSLKTNEQHTVQQLSGVVSNIISLKLEKTVKSEMKLTVLTGLEKVQKMYLEGLTNQIAQKLSVWERTLREESQELIKSKSIAESIGYAAASILEATIPNAYRDSFQNVLLPGFEKASMAMFMQINQTFQQGTKQYLERLENHLESKRLKQHEQQEPLIANLQGLVNSFQGTADRLTSGVESNLEALMQKQLKDATDRMQTNFGKLVESRIIPLVAKSISQCTSEAFSEWKAKVDESLSQMQNSSIAGASMLGEDWETKKGRVMQHAKKGEYNTAFEAALTASDLSLVMYLCKEVDPVELFSQPEKLPQPIILSLIQQLSVNLSEDTETKRKYLEETFMALDSKDEITREHMPGVLKGLNDQLIATIESLISTDSTNNQIKPLRMLLMASKSLLHGD